MDKKRFAPDKGKVPRATKLSTHRTVEEDGSEDARRMVTNLELAEESGEKTKVKNQQPKEWVKGEKPTKVTADDKFGEMAMAEKIEKAKPEKVEKDRAKKIEEEVEADKVKKVKTIEKVNSAPEKERKAEKLSAKREEDSSLKKGKVREEQEPMTFPVVSAPIALVQKVMELGFEPLHAYALDRLVEFMTGAEYKKNSSDWGLEPKKKKKHSDGDDDSDDDYGYTADRPVVVLPEVLYAHFIAGKNGARKFESYLSDCGISSRAFMECM